MDRDLVAQFRSIQRWPLTGARPGLMNLRDGGEEPFVFILNKNQAQAVGELAVELSPPQPLILGAWTSCESASCCPPHKPL